MPLLIMLEFCKFSPTHHKTVQFCFGNSCSVDIKAHVFYFPQSVRAARRWRAGERIAACVTKASRRRDTASVTRSTPDYSVRGARTAVWPDHTVISVSWFVRGVCFRDICLRILACLKTICYFVLSVVV